MAVKKPFIFTSVGYISNKTGDGFVRCREETVFEQVPSLKGTYQFKSINKKVFMPEEELIECDKKMMQRAGEVMSEYDACHPEEAE